MSSLYIFATQTGNIPLSELDDNFAEVSQRVNTANYVVAGNQSNITGVGTLTSLSVFGNVTAGNVSVTRNISAGNVRTTGVLSATGNVTGDYLFGDGGFLSNVTVTSNVAVTQIANGTSVITVNGSGGNATVQIAGTANVAVFQSTGVSVTGNVDAGNLRTTGTVSLAGNVIAAGVVSAGGNVIAAAINLYDGLYAVSASVSGNATIGNVITNGQITAVGNMRGANISTDGTVTAVGNVSGANFNTVGAVSAAGNVSGAYIFGNGSQLTGIVTSSYGNSNVTTLLSNLGSNAVSTTGNVSGGYFFGNGSQLSGLPATYGDSNVTALLSNLGSNVVSTTGNVTGSYIFGNGSQLTGIATSSYGNANVVANLAALSSNPVSTTGNVTAGNLLTTGTLYTTVISAGNTTVGNLLTTGTISALGNATFGNISTAGTFQAASFSATGNVTGSYIFGNGSQLTGIAESSYGNANVAAYLLINTGNISGNVISVSTLNAAVNISGANLRTTGVVSAQGNITVNNGSFFIGNGSQLTGIVAVSSYGDSNVVTLLSGYGSNVISTTGNVTAGNFVGNVVGTGAGTPTITSSGNLDLSVASAVRVIGGGTFRLPNLTTEQIANVTAANGDMVYNSTTSTIQGYEGDGWVRLSAGPLFTAYNSVNQSLTTGTANLVFSTSYDTNSYYSTSTGIFTPLKQGWYQVNAAMLSELTAGTANASIFIGLYKNGVIEAIGAVTTVTPTAATISNSTVSKFLYLDGSTDYINCKITSTINSGTWRTGITVANFFQANWVRD
jgi:hypothetical protein